MAEQPVLLYDGHCGFCKLWIDYSKRLTGDGITYRPSQEAGDQYPQIPPERYAEAVQLVLSSGEVWSGARAVFETLATQPGKRWLIWLYERHPLFAAIAEWCYHVIAARRSMFYWITKILFGTDIHPNVYEQIRSVFLGLLAAIYGIAFFSLWSQISGLAGVNGILPAGEFLKAVRENYGAASYWRAPTLFWIDSSNFALVLACIAGTLFAVILALGYLRRICLTALFVLYLSLTWAGQVFLGYQWDALLLEAGFLAIFLGSSPVFVWLYRFLLFRLLFQSGAIKLLSRDSAWRGLTALRFHYYTQPLPTPIAWYMHQLPDWFQQVSVVVMFAIELVAPFFLFAPRRLRLAAVGSVLFLQLMILLTGNYTFFNVLTLALCLFALDDSVISKKDWRMPAPFQAGRARRFALGLVAGCLALSGVLQLVEMFRGTLPAPAQAILRLESPFDLVNSYGLFAVMTKSRPEIVIEGSNDGLNWIEYEFRYKPGNVNRAPRWAAPHQPRLDWQMWFAALGNYRTNPWVLNLVARLLQGSPDVLRLLDKNPFPQHPPRFIRVLVYDYQFTNLKTHRATGAWWKRELKGAYMPAISLRQEALVE